MELLSWKYTLWKFGPIPSNLDQKAAKFNSTKGITSCPIQASRVSSTGRGRKKKTSRTDGWKLPWGLSQWLHRRLSWGWGWGIPWRCWGIPRGIPWGVPWGVPWCWRRRNIHRSSYCRYFSAHWQLNTVLRLTCSLVLLFSRISARLGQQLWTMFVTSALSKSYLTGTHQKCENG